jgi:hypothetical protein
LAPETTLIDRKLVCDVAIFPPHTLFDAFDMQLDGDITLDHGDVTFLDDIGPALVALNASRVVRYQSGSERYW